MPSTLSKDPVPISPENLRKYGWEFVGSDMGRTKNRQAAENLRVVLGLNPSSAKYVAGSDVPTDLEGLLSFRPA